MAFRRRTPRTALTWFEKVYDRILDRELKDYPHTLESQTLNKLQSVAAVLCIYADKDLHIHHMSKQFLAHRIGLKDTDFLVALRDLVNMGLLRLTPRRGSIAGSFQLLIPERTQHPQDPHSASNHRQINHDRNRESRRARRAHRPRNHLIAFPTVWSSTPKWRPSAATVTPWSRIPAASAAIRWYTDVVGGSRNSSSTKVHNLCEHVHQQ